MIPRLLPLQPAVPFADINSILSNRHATTQPRGVDSGHQNREAHPQDTNHTRISLTTSLRHRSAGNPYSLLPDPRTVVDLINAMEAPVLVDLSTTVLKTIARWVKRVAHSYGHVPNDLRSRVGRNEDDVILVSSNCF